MQFFPRAKQIILILLNENKPVSTKYIADKINVSKRTVQRDLDYISHSLKKYDLDLASKTGQGIWIEGNKEQKDILFIQLNQQHEFDGANKEERKQKLILELLKDREPKKIYYYSNKFKVSEATVRNDLDEIDKWMDKFDLAIIRKQGYGIYIEGKEDDYRKAVKACIDENLNKNNIIDIFKKNRILSFNEFDENNICELFDKDILEQVISCLQDINDKRILRLTEESYVGLVFHITIAIERCIKSETIETNENLICQLRSDENYNLAEYITKALEDKFKIEMPEIETAYICLHIKGAKLQYINENISNDEAEHRKSLIYLVGEMIDRFDSRISVELKNDEEFIEGLLTHLQPTIIRLNNKMSISNPLLDQIKEKYHDIYENSIKAAKVLEEKFNVLVPEDEIGFLALHFGAAIVRIKDKKEIERRVKVGVVCASGIGISRLMSVRIKKIFKGRIDVVTLSMDRINDSINENVDFLISSMNLGKFNGDFIAVNPLLLEDDLARINEKIRQYAHSSENVNEDTKDFSKELSNVALIAEQINVVIKNFRFYRFDENINFSELLESIGDKIASLEYGDNDLKDDISRKIQNSIMEREKLMSQIVPEFSLALLHSRCEGIKYPYFIAGRTRDNKSFNDSYFKNIETVITMIIPKDNHTKENGDIIGFLSSRLIEDDEFLDVIKECNEDKIRAFISSELRGYFNKYLNSVYNN